MKATDEKWDTEYDGLPIVYTDNGLLVATMYDPEQANLAAAAPDLYRALKMCANGLNTADMLNGDDLLTIQIDRETYRSINEALAKARGEE